MKYVQKLEDLTTFGLSDCLNNIYLYIKVLTLANSDQYFPAKGGQGHWLFHVEVNLLNSILTKY